MSENIFLKLTEIIKLQITSDGSIEVSENMRLKEDLGFDSLRIVSLILEIEEKMSLTFDDSDLDPSELLTVKDLNNLIKTTKQRGE